MSHKILLKYITFYQNFEISRKWMKNILIYSIHFSKTSRKWKKNLPDASLKFITCMQKKKCICLASARCKQNKECRPRSDCSHWSSLIRAYTFCHSVFIFCTHYCLLTPNCSTLKDIPTGNFWYLNFQKFYSNQLTEAKYSLLLWHMLLIASSGSGSAVI